MKLVSAPQLLLLAISRWHAFLLGTFMSPCERLRVVQVESFRVARSWHLNRPQILKLCLGELMMSCICHTHQQPEVLLRNYQEVARLPLVVLHLEISRSS